MKINYKIKKLKPGVFKKGDLLRVIKTEKVREDLSDSGILKKHIDEIFSTLESIVAFEIFNNHFGFKWKANKQDEYNFRYAHNECFIKI